MIRLTLASLTLSIIVAGATRAYAVEPQGWCYCNPDAPACRSLCPEPDPPLVMQEQGRYPRTWVYQPAPEPRPLSKVQRRNPY